jgi:tetratricopeptide (TPR) repeat protein
LIASEHWELRPEHDLAVAYIFWTDRAKRALDARKYELAQQLAARSLLVRPGQENALRVLAQAQFAQADFGAAASSYRKLLGLNKSRVEIADSYLYAQALAAADRSKAAAEFRRWEASLPGERPRDLQVSLAGLSLLAGDPVLAKNVSAVATAAVYESWAPDWLASMGWWFYRAGDYATAQRLLSDAVEQRPASAQITTELAWTQIENRKLADAMQTLTTTYDSSAFPDRAMAKAVGQWQARQPDDALSEFEAAIAGRPEWENERWVEALYSSGVAQSIQQMQAERLRRKQARTADNR